MPYVRPKLKLTPRQAIAFLGGGLLGLDVTEGRQLGHQRPRLVTLIADGVITYTDWDPLEQWRPMSWALARILDEGEVELDCEDLSTWLAADMRLDVGAPYYDPNARPILFRTGPRIAHIITESPRTGEAYDPSAWAGMSTPWPDAGIPADWLAWARAAERGHHGPGAPVSYLGALAGGQL